MTVQGSSGADDDRRPTTVRLTVEQLRWVRNQALDRRCNQNDVIVAALVAAGAPPG